MINTGLANAIVIIVTIIWVASFVLSIVSHDYRPDPQINVIFMAIVGAGMAFRRKPADHTNTGGGVS